jgi:hypothetical protein
MRGNADRNVNPARQFGGTRRYALRIAPDPQQQAELKRLPCDSHDMTDRPAGFFEGTEMPTAGWWEALWPDPTRHSTFAAVARANA